MGNKKEPIRASTWIIVAVAVLFVAGYFGYQLYQKIVTGIAEKYTADQALISSQQQALDDATKKIDDVKTQSQQEINDLKTQSEQDKTNFQNKIDDVQNSLNKQIANTGLSDADIVTEWQNRVARVECTWNSPSGKWIQTGQGSGTLVNMTKNGITLVTNKHVVSGDPNGPYFANWCVVGVYGKGARVVSNMPGNSPFVPGSDEDWAYVMLGPQYQSSTDPVFTDAGFFDQVVVPHMKVCTDNINIGDKIVVLGYPAIGTEGGITVTDGIVSGFEGDYYVTSAKIEHGNSGGAAILVKDDCYLGIPTWADSGTVESLARILKGSIVVGN